MKRERENITVLAWEVAALSRAEKLPDLAALLPSAAKPAPRFQTEDEIERNLRKWDFVWAREAAQARR